jgi:hypothetical protein
VRRAVLRLSLVVLLAGPALLGNAPPCVACTCTPRTPKQLFRHADAAFVGSVTSQQPVAETTTIQTFAVRSVFKGALGPTVDVIVPIGSGGGDTCGILYGGGKVAVILHRMGDGWTTDACSRITASKLAAVGPTPLHPSPEPTPSPTPIGPPTREGGGGLGVGAVVLGLLLGVAAIAAALSLGGRRDRTSSSRRTEAAEEVMDPVKAPTDPAPDPPERSR